MPVTILHTGISERALKTPRTADNMDKWHWTVQATLHWHSMERMQKITWSGAYRQRGMCALHLGEEREHLCWPEKAVREATGGDKEPNLLAEKKYVANHLWDIFDRVHRYECRLFSLSLNLGRERSQVKNSTGRRRGITGRPFPGSKRVGGGV